MALQPGTYNGQDVLQPGARGEQFGANIPGYRNSGDDRVNRTNNKLNTNAHDVPNIKYEFDRRLPVLFKYGFAFGYNQIVVPKGRIVAADPTMDLVDFDMHKQHNTLTLANGGAPVKLRSTGDYYKAGGGTKLTSKSGGANQVTGVGKEWTPVIGQAAAYTDLSYKPFATAGPLAQLVTAGLKTDANTGKIVNTNGSATTVVTRPGNLPLGVISRNEYTRDDDAYNGIMPGAVMTDAMIELPWFAFKDKAEENPWGSAYGGIFPGALVKSDENGRFVISPLSFPETESMRDIAEYEMERQQVVGQAYSVSNDLLPEGAAKWATWALEDRMNFNEFNPSLYAQNNRAGEDAVTNSPYNSEGKYPGYPYDRTIGENDLNMLASTARGFSNRMDPKYQYENLGIPGLTDGANAATRTYAAETIGHVNYAAGSAYVDAFFRIAEVNVVANTLQISVGGGTFETATVGQKLKGAAVVSVRPAPTPAQLDVATAAGTYTGADLNCHIYEDLTLNVNKNTAMALAVATIEAAHVASDTAMNADFITIKYADALQGIVVLEVAAADKAVADAYLQAVGGSMAVQAKYDKKGLAGVPTFMDWDGCVGSVKILLTK